jgi:predicted CXXCH cytochrome family protein
VRKVCVLAALVVLVGTTNGFAQIAGGPHDLSAGSALTNSNTTIGGQTCVFCHTPHNASATLPLWNRSAAAGAYTVYTSTTMNATAPTAAAIQSSVSGACLSCHDGSIAVDVLSNVNGAAFAGATFIVKTGATGAKATYGNSGGGTNNIMNGGIPFIGTDLRNDHPVTIRYSQSVTATPLEFVDSVQGTNKVTVGASGPLPLYGAVKADATVECASCHNPHSNTNGSFLRKPNTGSALCLTCHIK